MPVPKEMKGKSGSRGADAFQQLARYVRDVRVAEHQQIGGKSVTTIDGEIDTAGLLKAVTELGSPPVPGGEKPAFSFDLEDMGLEIGDIKAVLSIDESTHLLSTALVTLSMVVQDRTLQARAAVPAHELEQAGQASRPSLVNHEIRGMDPDRQWWRRVPAVFLSPKSVFAAMRDESRRTSKPVRSPCSRSSGWPG